MAEFRLIGKVDTRYNILRLWSIRFFSIGDWHLITPMAAISLSPYDIIEGLNRRAFSVCILAKWIRVPYRESWLWSWAWHGESDAERWRRKNPPKPMLCGYTDTQKGKCCLLFGHFVAADNVPLSDILSHSAESMYEHQGMHQNEKGERFPGPPDEYTKDRRAFQPGSEGA